MVCFPEFWLKTVYRQCSRLIVLNMSCWSWMLWQQAGKEDSITGGRHSPTVIAVHLLKLSPMVNWFGIHSQVQYLRLLRGWGKYLLEGNHAGCLLLHDFDASEKTNKRPWGINHQLKVKYKFRGPPWQLIKGLLSPAARDRKKTRVFCPGINYNNSREPSREGWLVSLSCKSCASDRSLVGKTEILRLEMGTFGLMNSLY